MAMFGVQTPAPFAGQEALDELWAACAPADSREVAAFTDQQGYANRVVFTYWKDPAAFQAWMAEQHGDLLSGPGRWIEVLRPAASDFETLYSADSHPEGIARVADGFSPEISEHGYWGSMRDRMPSAQTDPLEPVGAPAGEQHGPITVVRPHGNLALIRSGQDWMHCGPEERESYFGDVEPQLRAGMDFLERDGADIGCFSNRYLQSCLPDGTLLQQSFGLSFWNSLADLEAWAESHPTHVRIFGAAMRFLQQTANTRLRLSHEVFVVPADRQYYAYRDCHPGTGMLAKL